MAEEKTLDEAEVQQAAYRAILQEGIQFEITGRNKKRQFRLFPLPLGAIIKITRELEMFDFDFDKINENQSIFGSGVEMVRKYHNPILNIAVIAISNGQTRLWRWFGMGLLLKRFLMANLTPNELLQLMTLIINQMDMKDFFYSMVLIKGVSLTQKTEAISGAQSAA